MEMLENLVLVTHVLAALSIIGLVMLQQGKGAEMGSGFGSGSSNTVFGSGGAGNFLTQATTIVAVLFFVTSFSLAYFAGGKVGIVKEVGIPSVQQANPADIIQAGTIDVNVPDIELVPEQASQADLELPVDDESGDAELPEL